MKLFVAVEALRGPFRRRRRSSAAGRRTPAYAPLSKLIQHFHPRRRTYSGRVPYARLSDISRRPLVKTEKALVRLGEGGVVHVVAPDMIALESSAGQVGGKFHFGLSQTQNRTAPRARHCGERPRRRVSRRSPPRRRAWCSSPSKFFSGLSIVSVFAAEVELGDRIGLAVGFAGVGGFA